MYDPTKPYKDKILSLVKKTWSNPYISLKESTYTLIRRKKVSGFMEVDHTDGIGTKGIYHWQKRTFRNAVLDALAMNLNDLAMVRARPYKLQNHISLPEDDHGAVLEIVESLANECHKRKIVITGGETSINDLAEGFDIGITISGLIKKPQTNRFRIGDFLVGVKSNGLHSNGFTKVRNIFKGEYRPEFTKPTEIYLDTILKLDKKYVINGMMHITGGAFTKLKSLLKNSDVFIKRNHKLRPQKIFKELYKREISDEDMYKTFNCGIGFIFSTSPKSAKKIVHKFKDMDIIGNIVKGIGRVKIESGFSKSLVEF